MSSVPLVRRAEPSELSLRRPGALLRLTAWLRHRVVLAARPPARTRMLLLTMLGLALTVSVAGAALVSLSQVGERSQQLAEVNRAQRFHQDADMMHDALRADVSRAQQAAGGARAVNPELVRTETQDHAGQFRRNLRGIQALSLPTGLARALDDLRPTQEAYLRSAERMVRASLLDLDRAPGVRADHERAFQALVSAQAEVTDLLAATSQRTERAVVAERHAAVQMIGLASLGAIGGWLGLLMWHQRSMGNLHRALVREAAHRSATDVLQRSLLPGHLPTVPGVDLASRSLPGEAGHRVGGDWYDVIVLPTGELGLVVGDVLGHDLAAASAMAQLRNALRAYALDDLSPAGVLSRVNRAADLLDVVELATCVYAIFDPCTLTVRWSSAGHLAPLVSRVSGTGRLASADPGPPLGALPEAAYVDNILRLGPGDALALFTDGLVERRGQCIDTGLADLTAVRGPHPSAETMCDRVLSALLGDTGHSDDVTLLVLRTAAGDRAATT